MLFGAASGPVPPVDPQRLNQAGSVYLTRPKLGDYIATRAELTARAAAVFAAVADGTVDVRIGHRYPLAEARSGTPRPGGPPDHRQGPARPVTPTPFHDLAAFAALPRCAGLVLSPDGTRLVTAVATPDTDGTRYRTALWEVDPTGVRPARRLTRGDPGEHDAAFTPAGDLLFLSARPVPGESDDDPPPALWTLPAGGGEAVAAGTRPGGLGRPVVARDAGTVVCTSATLPGAVTAADDATRRAARKDAKVTAILHEGTSVRFWDHDLGPARPRLLAASPIAAGPGGGELLTWTDLTPVPGGALDQAEYDVTPDGSTVVVTWRVDEPNGTSRNTLVALDVAGEHGRRTLLDDADHTVDGPVAVSPDGRWLVCRRTRRTTATEPPDHRCVVVPVGGSGDPGAARDVAPGWDRWITAFAWTPDSATLVVTADDGGRAPLFRVDLAGGTPTRLTDDHGAYSDPVVGPDGTVYALRSRSTPRPHRSGSVPPVSRFRCPRPPRRPRCPAASPRSPPPPTTAHPCAPGWCSPTVPPRRPPPRSCCGSTAAR